MAWKMCTNFITHVSNSANITTLTFMILLLAISPQSCKCKNGSDWLKKLADAKIIFIRQEYNYTRGL